MWKANMEIGTRDSKNYVIFVERKTFVNAY